MEVKCLTLWLRVETPKSPTSRGWTSSVSAVILVTENWGTDQEEVYLLRLGRSLFGPAYWPPDTPSATTHPHPDSGQEVEWVPVTVLQLGEAIWFSVCLGPFVETSVRQSGTVGTVRSTKNSSTRLSPDWVNRYTRPLPCCSTTTDWKVWNRGRTQTSPQGPRQHCGTPVQSSSVVSQGIISHVTRKRPLLSHERTQSPNKEENRRRVRVTRRWQIVVKVGINLNTRRKTRN